MAKFLLTASYTAQGTKGLLTEGATSRKAAIETALKGVGGKLDAMYFAYGDADVILIADMPDNASALALSMVVNASGAVEAHTTPLLTIEEVDAACKKSVAYRPAGAAAV